MNAFNKNIYSSKIVLFANLFLSFYKEMRENFPSSSLLTSRSVNHGMLMAEETTTLDPACQKNVANYFATGVISFVDGTVCEVSIL